MVNSNVIIVSSAGAVITIVLIIALVTRGRYRLTCPLLRLTILAARRSSFDSCNPSVGGDVEKYGELYIPPNRRPVHVALDIINRVLLGIALPLQPVTVSSFGAGSAMELGLAPRLSLTLTRSTSITPSEQVQEIMSEAEASTAAMSSERNFLEQLRNAVQLASTGRDAVEEQRQLQAEERMPECLVVEILSEMFRGDATLESQDVFVVSDWDEDEDDDDDKQPTYARYSLPVAPLCHPHAASLPQYLPNPLLQSLIHQSHDPLPQKGTDQSSLVNLLHEPTPIRLLAGTKECSLSTPFGSGKTMADMYK